jgi:hypothetical protein
MVDDLDLDWKTFSYSALTFTGPLHTNATNTTDWICEDKE